jgi:hypothetical protein
MSRKTTRIDSSLRYVKASRIVTSDAGELGGVELRGRADEKLGTLDGVIVDPARSQVRYFVVESPGWLRRRRYLLPMMPASVDAERHTLRLEVGPLSLAECPELDAETLRLAS